MSQQVILWVGFNLFILGLLALDLGVFHRKAEVVKVKEAFVWSVIWIIVALLFNLGVYIWRGQETALQFLTGYIIERSLSVDNIFVFLMVFSYFRVPAAYQHKILYWGILGALVMRALFIWIGVELIERFHWAIYVFGALLVYTGIRMAFHKDEEIHPEKNPVLRLFRRLMPVSNTYDGSKFFVKSAGRWMATPMFIVLLVIETTDVIFAVDSIPAVMAITLDPFIIYTSNVFAILGLRALYFAVAGMMDLFHYLNYGLSIILVFVGAKMLLVDVYKMPIWIALGVVGGILAISIIASLLRPRPEVPPPPVETAVEEPVPSRVKE